MLRTRRLVAAVGVLLACLATASSAAAKATPPLDLAFAYEGVGPAPGTVRLALRCTPRLATSRLRIRVRLPASVRLQGGALAWQGPCEARATRIVRMTLALPPGRYGVVTATAVMDRPSRGRWVQAAEWSFHRSERSPTPGRVRGRPRPEGGGLRKAGLLRPGGYREIAPSGRTPAGRSSSEGAGGPTPRGDDGENER